MTDRSNGAARDGLKISPSLLAANFADIRQVIRMVDDAGVDSLHLDVMDGRFVPNITWGPKIIADLRPLSQLPFDTHLMIVEPEKYVGDFVKAGSDIVTVHWVAHGTNSGQGKGLPGKGKQGRAQGTSKFRFDNSNRIAEVWVEWNEDALRKQVAAK